ncbi:NAD(P)H-dependent oxidoreductase [Xenorhabdus beddingii]
MFWCSIPALMKKWIDDFFSTRICIR